MKLKKEEIKSLLKEWITAWDNYDFEKMMTFYHEDIYFENWTGAYIKGIDGLRKAWKPWFDNHGNFIVKKWKDVQGTYFLHLLSSVEALATPECHVRQIDLAQLPLKAPTVRFPKNIQQNKD